MEDRMPTRPYCDSLGRLLQVPTPPRRLLALVPSLTETLFASGYGPQVVGVTTYCTEPAAAVATKPRLGGTKNPDIAAILALRPELVLAVAEENRPQDVEALTQAGIPVYVFDPRTVRDGIDLLWRLAELLTCPDHVRAHIEAIEQVYAETQALVAQRPRVRVFCPIWKDPYMTINEDTYLHDVLRVCGGDNIFAHRQRRFPLSADLGHGPEATGTRYEARDRRYPRVTLAEMAALHPDVVLLPDEPYVFRASDLADFAPFNPVPAVQQGRIHLIDGKLRTWYGPRLGASLQTVRALCSP